MSTLQDDIRKAMELGISYGKYKARTRTYPAPPPQKPPPAIHKRKPHHYNDEQLFLMWQSRMTDAEIAAEVGISRAMVQRWRDSHELPSIYRNKNLDTKKFRIVETPYGTYVIQD